MTAKKNGYMRETMPECAAFIDALRDRGFIDDAHLRAALADGRAYFEEAGHVIGNAAGHAERDAREQAHKRACAKEGEQSLQAINNKRRAGQ